MGKLKDLAMVKSTNTNTFAYLPPDAAFDAMRILVKVDLGTVMQPHSPVSMPVLASVLRGLRRASPLGRIVVIEGIASNQDSQAIFDELGIINLLDNEMRITDADNLIMHEYPNQRTEPAIYPTMTATEYIKDYDCVVSISTLKQHTVNGDDAQVGASLKNLLGIFPQAQYETEFAAATLDDLLADVYFTIGQYIDGAVIDLTHLYTDDEAISFGKVVWGDDLLSVDEVACQMANIPAPSYIKAIRTIRKQQAK
ncbi:MAG: DUF362 domain-containing protein [Phototrophicaceae bacterium]